MDPTPNDGNPQVLGVGLDSLNVGLGAENFERFQSSPEATPEAPRETPRRFRIGGRRRISEVQQDPTSLDASPPSQLQSDDGQRTPTAPPTPKFACGPIRSPSQSPQRFITVRGPNRLDNNMSYQNYIESPQMGAGPRQAPSPSQGMNPTNGVNGGGVMPGMMANLPTPAGHQSDLNHIYNMVEALHNELAETRARSERIISAAGQIRQRALEQNLSTDEIIASVATELNDSTKNLEEENSRLRRELEHATHEEAAYKELTHQVAAVMGNALELAHAYKLKTTLDMCAWHRSYREQLATEREENLNLRCRITDMQASAARGMEQLRLLQHALHGSDLVMELRTEIVSLRQQARGWKRVALSELPSDDSEFSDDSDVIDVEEKKRLARLDEEKSLKAELAAKHADDDDAAHEDDTAAALAAALAASSLLSGDAGAAGDTSA